MADNAPASVTLFLPENGIVDPWHVGAMLRDLTTEGVTTAAGLVVSQRAGTPTMGVDVAAGAAVVYQDAVGGEPGPAYRVVFNGTVQLDVAAADGSNPRHDLVVAEVLDPTFGGLSTQGRVRVVPGTPATPADPALPDNAIPLARILVGAAVSSVGDGVITDLREPSGRPGEVGRFDLYAVAALPWGAVALDGSTYQRARYRRLWALVSGLTGWGNGDGTLTFTAPDVRDRFPVAAGSTYGLGATGGEATHVLTEAELAAHGHTMAAAGLHNHGSWTGPGGAHTPAVNRVNGTGTDGGYFPRGATGTPGADSSGIYGVADHVHGIDNDGSHSHSINPAGSGAAHENRPPYRAFVPAIRA